MVINIGSMAVKAVFNGAGLLSGLGKTSDKFKEVSMRSKSTTTEMKRMQHGAHTLRNALAAIGVGGFTALMMTAPQLAGSLAKIKYEMQQLAWSVGKHLKPALDSVATILRGIRTGDWSVVKEGIQELVDSIAVLTGKVITVVVDAVFGEGSAEKASTDFNNWWENLNAAYEEGDLGKFAWTLVAEPVIWAGKVISDWMSGVAKWLKTSKGKKELLDAVVLTSTDLKLVKGVYDFAKGWGQGEKTSADSHGFGGGYQTGGYVPRTGMYKLHQGETVTMKGSNGMSGNMGSSNITLDFSGANINLASGIELNEFANQISLKIAERQQSLTY